MTGVQNGTPTAPERPGALARPSSKPNVATSQALPCYIGLSFVGLGRRLGEVQSVRMTRSRTAGNVFHLRNTKTSDTGALVF